MTKKTVCLTWIGALALTCISVSAGPMSGANPGMPDLDVRLPHEPGDRGGFVLREPGPAREAALERFLADHPGATVRWDGMSGSPRWLASAPGATLSPATPGDPEAIARGFLLSHADLFGLTPHDVRSLRRTSVVRARGGGHHVYFTQTVGGLDTFDGTVQLLILADGAVRSLGSTLYADLMPPSPPVIGPTEAVRRALVDVYPKLSFAGIVESSKLDGDRETVFDIEGFGLPPKARLVVLPTATDALLAWNVEVAERSLYTSYRILVDAAGGSILYRENTTEYADASYLDDAYPLPKTEEFSPDNYVLATIPASTTESPSGWIAGDGTSLEGNNATSHLRWRGEAGLAEPSAVYDYPFQTTRSALVNAWWWANQLHDHLYALGFDEQAGNYQNDNFGNGGVGGDPIGVVAIDGAPRNQAFFGPGNSDGSPSWINFSWISCRFCGDHDGRPEQNALTGGERHGGFSRAIVIHEYMHGVSNRRVGGPGTAGCVNVTQANAMGEAWGDVLARSMTGVLFEGFYEGTGINRRPDHDLTYGDLCLAADAGCQEHVDGLIFVGALWDLRQSMIAFDPTNGVREFEELIIEAMAVTPCDPSMLDARDAILVADDNLFALAHEDLIWNAFAARGMGDDATTTGGGDTAPVEGFSVPAASACTPPEAPVGLNAVAEGNNAIRLTYDASASSAVEVWREDIDNSVDRPVLIGYSTDLTTFLDTDVDGGKSYRYHVVGIGTGGVVCSSGLSTTADATATGACDAYPLFVPNLTVTDGAADCSVALNWSTATSGCPGAATDIVYNVYRAPTPGYDASERLLIGRTTDTTFRDVPPENDEYPIGIRVDPTSYYLVLAQHGTLDDPPDHRQRGSSQVLEWVPGIPTLGRTTVESWDFESGPQGWTADNTADPVGGWVLADPTPTSYGGMPLAPGSAAGGSTMAWVTGDGVGNIAENDCNAVTLLTSPEWDATGGATILSYDYWAVGHGNFWFGLEARISNGTSTIRVATVGLRTAQPFETDDEHSWQHAELNVARWMAPTSTMSVTFAGFCGWPFGEFGIDNVRVERADRCARSSLEIDSVVVDDTPPGWGNGNGVLEPGETARLDVVLANTGSVTAFAPVGTLTSHVPGILVHEDTASFPDIPADGTGGVLGNGFTVTAPTGIDCSSDSAVLEFEFRDAADTFSHDTWNPEYGATITDTVFSDTFETDKGWISQGLSGRGRFMRGDPVGTMNGADQANPENDSPNDPGAQCYVTENGPVGGAAAATDVDRDLTGLVWPRLASPWFDLSTYKRAVLYYDMWLYDDSSSTTGQDYLEIQSVIQVGSARGTGVAYRTGNPSGWVSVSEDLTRLSPLTTSNRIEFFAYDNNPDHVVEVGIDNVVVEGYYQVCDPLGVTQPPNGVGESLRVNRVGGDVEVSWTASVVDATHDGAAWYELYRSGMPSGGFTVVDTATSTSAIRPLVGLDAFFLLTAVNSAGTSGDEPAP